MKPIKAVTVLAVPFALACLLLLGGMCLTPYWECLVLQPVSIGRLWKPAAFTLALFSVCAAVVLYVDLLVIRSISTKDLRYRPLITAVIGAAIATAPRVVVAGIGGQGLGALSPQLEFLPFAITGALFAILVDRVTARESN